MKFKNIAPVLACLLCLALSAGSAGAYFIGNSVDQERNQAVAGLDVALTGASVQLDSVINRINAIAVPGAQGGQSSGNGPMGIGVWGMGGGAYLSNSKDGSRFDGTFTSGLVGVDKQLGDLLFGVAFGVESLDLSTKYNSGSIAYDGFSVTPYLSYAFKKDLVADASFSYGWMGYTMKNTQAGTKRTDHMDGDRRVTSLGLTQYLPLDKLLLSGRLGAMYLDEHEGSYNLGALRFSPAGIYALLATATVNASYDLGAFKPSLGLTYSQSVLKSGRKEQDLWGVDLVPGLTYSVSDRLQLGLNGVFGVRESLTKAGGLLSLRYDF